MAAWELMIRTPGAAPAMWAKTENEEFGPQMNAERTQMESMVHA